jgi:hypothetical protein
MDLKYLTEQFKRLTPITQIALIILALVVIALVIYYPTAGSSIIAFLIALKTLFTKQPM